MRNELCSTNTPELELINPNLAADGKGGIELLCFSLMFCLMCLVQTIWRSRMN